MNPNKADQIIRTSGQIHQELREQMSTYLSASLFAVESEEEHHKRIDKISSQEWVSVEEYRKLEAKNTELETQSCTEKNCCVLGSHEILRRKRTEYWKQCKRLSEQIKTIEKLMKEFPDSRKYEGDGDKAFDISKYLHDIAVWYVKLKHLVNMSSALADLEQT